MVHRGQGHPGSQEDGGSGDRAEKKTPEGLHQELEALYQKCRGAFKQERTFERAKLLSLSQLACLGRHTVSGLICASGRQFEDWSADYRLFSKGRIDMEAVFKVVRQGVTGEIPQGEPLVVAMDDTILRKRGTKTPGVSWRRDPLGPAFNVNFIRAQRVLQLSAAIPRGEGAGPARMIPIAFEHAPTPKKPRKWEPEEAWSEYRRKAREQGLGRRAAERVKGLRASLDYDGERERDLWMVVDGGFTNRNLLRGIPDRTTVIGRLRKDAKLYHPPVSQEGRGAGRKKLYGDRARTPEELRQDEDVPWQEFKVFAAGKVHDFKVKTIAPLLWRAAGAEHMLRLIVIAPLGYRPRKGSRVLYRKPAFLICTDPDLPVEKVLQAYVWRWDIEVNFKDEKQIIGVGEAQVHSEDSVENAPSFAVASYAMLLLAGHRAFGYEALEGSVPPPKWRAGHQKPRATTLDLINQLRAELWGEAMGRGNFSGFMNKGVDDTKPEKSKPCLVSSVLYAA